MFVLGGVSKNSDQPPPQIVDNLERVTAVQCGVGSMYMHTSWIHQDTLFICGGLSVCMSSNSTTKQLILSIPLGDTNEM